MNTSPTVLIAGAGPSGLVLALSLVKHNIPILIIEKEPKPRLGQRGSGIQPRSMEIYNFLGVLPQIQKRASPSLMIQKYELPGGTKPLKTWRLSQQIDPTPGFPYLSPSILGQNNLEEVLRDALAKYPGGQVQYATALQGFEQYGDHVVAHVIKTQDGEEIAEDIRCSWLVGTDGARGVVRKQLGCTFLGETRESQRLVVGDIRVTGLSKEYWHMWGEPTSAMAIFRPTEDDDVFSFYVASTEFDNATLLADREELLKCFYAVTQRTELVFGEISWITEYRPNIRMVDKFGEERVFIAGDAAHVHSPTGGQGLNSSIQDSFNLGWKLALVESGFADPALVSSYSTERLPVIAEMLNITTKLLNKTFTPGDHSAWLRGEKLLQLGVNYRTSPIVLDEHLTAETEELKALYAQGICVATSLAAGDRASDAPGLVAADGKSTSLFRGVFGVTYHTVLIFRGAEAEEEPILKVLQAYPSGTVRSAVILPRSTPVQTVSGDGSTIVLEDRDGHAFSVYGVSLERTTVVIVRPDGVIGAIVSGEAGTKQYFSKIFR